MKKLFFPIPVLFAAIILSSCGGSSVEVSPKMSEFLKKFDKPVMLQDVVGDFGFTGTEYALDLYELKEPTVKSVATDGDKTCYTVNFKHGMVDSDAIVCWNGEILVEIKEAPAAN